MSNGIAKAGRRRFHHNKKDITMYSQRTAAAQNDGAGEDKRAGTARVPGHDLRMNTSTGKNYSAQAIDRVRTP
ncbi:hypothetical protein [Acidovorax sp. LjRoot194]|uniref:hypothetical protein n=1 Tax=Acidovorax sp. LjRoot194 TaxID=3342280 RepID=UPI003ECE7BE6